MSRDRLFSSWQQFLILLILRTRGRRN
jgi:hypothetical protein